MTHKEEARMAGTTGEGCQIVLVDAQDRVLLQLRDEKDWIPFPGMWALPGGMREGGESPEECIRREMSEEMGIELAAGDVTHLWSRVRSYGTEHTFTAHVDIAAEKIRLTEGQEVRWFHPSDAVRMSLAYEDNAVLAEFLQTPRP